ncbi:hypothetical protein [Bradyrhizobium sp. B117]|uniref:hypothetical protein n=1 Tax=Bradyrhizobium sp. B117 TaxID=3140246 RepID=UPI00318421F1
MPVIKVQLPVATNDPTRNALALIYAEGRKFMKQQVLLSGDQGSHGLRRQGVFRRQLPPRSLGHRQAHGGSGLVMLRRERKGRIIFEKLRSR